MYQLRSIFSRVSSEIGGPPLGERSSWATRASEIADASVFVPSWRRRPQVPGLAMLQIARQPVPRRPATSVESGETAYVFASCIAFSDMARSVSVAQLIDVAMPVPTSAVRRGLENACLGFDENTEEGKRARAEAIARACGFDGKAVAKERCLREAFATIWV